MKTLTFLTRTQICPKVSLIIIKNDNNGKKVEWRTPKSQGEPTWGFTKV
jgi:hypothetical protein